MMFAGEKKNDPLAMYAGDIMTVNVNLAGLPALVLPCGFVEGGAVGLPVGLQIIGAAFDEFAKHKCLLNGFFERNL
ncbi:hypothetical protein ES332_D06G230000v1 [Gossypium tomentosum]|uniref:Amidase domain-containing protein n=1 Tax=Gossypium tomentosum TaxID=34277 RepID=A0A5D2KMX8_GOSTO|nr:hypothetical protein ES332_D06G230000v1 [Gossypium tomentosum]